MIKKALFWDFDGTLIHPNESFLHAMQFALESMRYKADLAEIRNFLHAACSWHKPEESYEKAVGPQWWEALFMNYAVFYDQCKIKQADRKALNKRFKDYILDGKDSILYADAEDILRECRSRGYKNYMISNNFPELPAVVEKMGLSEYFSGYSISSRVGFEKPRLALFQHALHIAGHPDLCCMIGDNPIADIQGGKNAGMKTILVHGGKHAEADYACDTLMDIRGILLDIETMLL